MIDLDQIKSVFANLEIYQSQLWQLAQLSLDELEEDLLKQGAAKYYLQVAVESCLDVANHLIARMGFRAPESYADSFTVLAENQVVDHDFLPTLHQMARMRNRLVHLYWDIDTEVLYTTLGKNLDDFDRFKACILRYLQRWTDGLETGSIAKRQETPPEDESKSEA